jgi:hypothetical protein
MSLLKAKDKDFITDNVRELIINSGLTGNRYTPDPNAEILYGKNDVPYIAGESFSLELQALPADTLTKMGADAVINILPEQELTPEDRVEISGVMYKVLNVEEQNCFGVVSHKTVRLVRHHGG